MRPAPPSSLPSARQRERSRRGWTAASILAFGVAMVSVGAADPTQTENVSAAVRAATNPESAAAGATAAPASAAPASTEAAPAPAKAAAPAAPAPITSSEPVLVPAASAGTQDQTLEGAAVGTAAVGTAAVGTAAAGAPAAGVAAIDAGAAAPETAAASANAAGSVPWDPIAGVPPAASTQPTGPAETTESVASAPAAPAPAAAAPVAEAPRAPRRASAPRASLLPLVQPLWSELTDAQRQILAPLEPQWNVMSQSRKRPWLTLADRIPRMNAETRAKAEARIREWAALTPEQRRLARNNYRLARALPKDQRVASWEQYQQMTPEQQAVLRQSGWISNTAARYAEAFTGLAIRASQPLSLLTQESRKAGAAERGAAGNRP